MYFSTAKRRLVTRIWWLGATVMTLCCLYLKLPWLQDTFCPQNGYILSGYVCPGTEPGSWNLFHHLGGNGPWISRAPEGHYDSLPLKCQIDQVHMIARHAERFPTINAGKRHIALINRLNSTNTKLTGSLEFLKEWTYFTNISSPQFEDLTSEGPYAGTLQAHRTGLKLREKYMTLVNPNTTTNFWTCASERDVATAKHFADGFFGAGWETNRIAKLHVIPESADRAADSLTPGDTCLKYREDEIYGHDRGYRELAKWQDVFTEPIAARLSREAGGLSFSALEIYSMMEMCGFEILARGSSSWCQVFSHREWLDFEYGRDLLHFYRAGPGNEYAGAMGWLWLNATTELMANDEASGVYFSFVHDGDIVPLVATLGILDESKNPGFLPNDKLQARRKWKTSDIVPMSGRLIFEKVTCHNFGLGQNLHRSYVRLYINDGIVDLEKSMFGGGLAYSVGLAQWQNIVREKGRKYGDFREICGLSSEAPSRITFLQPQP